MFFAVVLAVSWNLLAKGGANSIYIRPDGSVEPSSTPIQRTGDRYNFVDNVTGNIFVQVDNLLIDGLGYWLRGDGAGYGFDLTGRRNVTITNCTIRNFWVGIHVYSSSDIFLLNNHIEKNTASGIQILSSDGNCLIENNSVTGSGNAVWVGWSIGSNISRNHIAGNFAGISIISSPVVMRDNNISENSYNFGVDGTKLSDFMSDIDTSNVVNNQSIYYWVNKEGLVVPPDAGYVAVVNSTSIIVEDLTLKNNGEGAMLCYTSNSLIRNVTSPDDYYGITLYQSSNNSIIDCDVENNYLGISLKDSLNNSIAMNRVVNNRNGIMLEGSSGNRIYHNDFRNYDKQAADAESTNEWDDGYPSGGNYWSDYIGRDLYSGVNQNVTGSDKIGDSPCTINGDNKDNYPLMQEWIVFEDKAPPLIGIPYSIPTGDIMLDQETLITVNVTDVESGVENVTLSYKLGNATSWTVISMNYNTTLGLYEAVIPGQPNPVEVYYEITAFDNAGNIAAEDNAGSYYTYMIIPEQILLIGLSLLLAALTLIIPYARKKNKLPSSSTNAFQKNAV